MTLLRVNTADSMHISSRSNLVLLMLDVGGQYRGKGLDILERAQVWRVDRWSRAQAVRWKDGLDATGIRTAGSWSHHSDFEYVEAGPSIVGNVEKRSIL
jgi:hypothetical protein